MMKTYCINSFEDLVTVLKENDLTISQMNKITGKAINSFCALAETKEQFINSLIAFWDKYGHKSIHERPIFIDIEDPLAEKEELNRIVDSL
jgi:hypothetical protein